MVMPTLTCSCTLTAKITYLSSPNSPFPKDGYIRADGLMIHKHYVMQVKAPAESKYPWDYYKLVKEMSGEEAYGPITGLCPFAAK